MSDRNIREMDRLRRRTFIVALGVSLAGCTSKEKTDPDNGGGSNGGQSNTDGMSNGGEKNKTKNGGGENGGGGTNKNMSDGDGGGGNMSEDGNGGTDSGSDDGSSDGDSGDEGGGGEPSFELVRIEGPDQAEINSPIAFEVFVKNTGNGAGRFTSSMVYKGAIDEWQRASQISLFIKSGDTESVITEQIYPQYVTDYVFRIGDFDKEKKVEALAATRAFGESYKSPINTNLRAVILELVEGNDKKLAWVNVEFENQSSFKRQAPTRENFSLVVDGEVYQPVGVESEDKPGYEGREVNRGGKLEGWIPFEIPNVKKPKISFKYQEKLEDGTVGVFWKA